MTTVENIVTRPGGAVVVGGRVRVRLIASIPAGGAGFATDRTIISERWLVTDSVGAWSADLTPNASVTPAGTVYEVVENAGHGGATAYYVDVPSSGGPYWTGDILTVDPAALPVYGIPLSPTLYQGQGFDFWRSAANLTVTSGAYAALAMDPTASPTPTTYDPAAIRSASAIQRGSAFYALPAYHALLLRPGLWQWVIFAEWDTNLVGRRGIGFNSWQEEIDNDPTTDPLFGNPVYGIPFSYGGIEQAAVLPPSSNGLRLYQQAVGLLEVPVSPAYGNVAFRPSRYQSSGSDRTLYSYEITLAFLGNPRG